MYVSICSISSWWFQTFFIFTPTCGNDPIWLIFFRWVETTNQIRIISTNLIVSSRFYSISRYISLRFSVDVSDWTSCFQLKYTAPKSDVIVLGKLIHQSCWCWWYGPMVILIAVVLAWTIPWSNESFLSFIHWSFASIYQWLPEKKHCPFCVGILCIEYSTPWKINGWNLKITYFKRKIIFQTSIIMFHVNLRGCS